MQRSRWNHSSKFKGRVAPEALRGEATLADLASRYGVLVIPGSLCDVSSRFSIPVFIL